MCVNARARTWPNINQIFLCLEFCGPLGWNCAITSITSTIVTKPEPRALSSEKKKPNTNNKLKSLACFVRAFLRFYFPTKMRNRTGKTKKSSFASAPIANDALHIVWLVSFTLSTCFQKEHFKREFRYRFSTAKRREKERERKSRTASALLWFGVVCWWFLPTTTYLFSFSFSFFLLNLWKIIVRLMEYICCRVCLFIYLLLFFMLPTKRIAVWMNGWKKEMCFFYICFLFERIPTLAWLFCCRVMYVRARVCVRLFVFHFMAHI